MSESVKCAFRKNNIYIEKDAVNSLKADSVLNITVNFNVIKLLRYFPKIYKSSFSKRLIETFIDKIVPTA